MSTRNRIGNGIFINIPQIVACNVTILLAFALGGISCESNKMNRNALQGDTDSAKVFPEQADNPLSLPPPLKPAVLGSSTAVVDNVKASSTYNSDTDTTWNENHAADGLINSTWSSKHIEDGNKESILFNFEKWEYVNYVKLTPRRDGLGFPRTLRIQWADEKKKWKDIRTVDVPTNHSGPLELFFPTEYTESIIVRADVPGTDDNNNCYFQLNEFEAGYNPNIESSKPDFDASDVFANTHSAPWDASHLIDGDSETIWSTPARAEEASDSDENYFSISFNDKGDGAKGSNHINYMKLYPRETLGFPKKFRLAVKTDGKQHIVRNITVPINDGKPYILTFPTVYAQEILMIADVLTQEPANGNYYFQLREVEMGYDPVYDNFQFVANSDTDNDLNIDVDYVTVKNVGSSDFNPTYFPVGTCTDTNPNLHQINISGANSKYLNLVQDVRNPIIDGGGAEPTKEVDSDNPTRYTDGTALPNVYAPSVVFNEKIDGTTEWNIYFGGWLDGEEIPQKDAIYLTTADPSFSTISTNPKMMIETNYEDLDDSFHHANNPSVIKVHDGFWLMMYTTGSGATGNTTSWAKSVDGVRWTSVNDNREVLLATRNHTISMDMGAAPPFEWGTANPNGSNALIYDGGKYHLFFSTQHSSYWENVVKQTEDEIMSSEWSALLEIDKNVQHAVSQNGEDFVYVGVAYDNVNNIGDVVVDIKRFVFDENEYYLIIYFINGSHIRYAITQDLNTFNYKNVLFDLEGTNAVLPTAGLVSDGKRLYGVLYGFSNEPTQKMNNVINAIWLQKKVVFKKGSDNPQPQNAEGPDVTRIKIYETDTDAHGKVNGKFYVHAEGVNVAAGEIEPEQLYESPEISLFGGDVWEYRPSAKR